MQTHSTPRHPRALNYLFLTEMWERFGFYLVQGALVLYMTKAFGFSDDKSYIILGVFSGLAYISPLAGGWLADKVLGFKTSIVWGGFFLFAGYLLFALPFEGLFYIALATIVMGTGLFKPSVSSLLGALYAPQDSSRDSGFTIFYIGINLGALLSGSSGIFQRLIGWHATFSVASLGLLIGIATFVFGVKKTGMHYAYTTVLAEHRFFTKKHIFLYCLLTIALFSLLIKISVLGHWLLPALGILLLIYIFRLAYQQPKPYRQQMIVLNCLIISSVVFWSMYMQIFNSATLFIDRMVDKNIFGWQIPTTVFYTLVNFFIIVLGIPFVWLWHVLNRYAINPSAITKFVGALIFIGLAFFVLALSTYYPNENHLVNAGWILASYFLITVGELLLSPIGLSAITLYSPPQLTGMMMGIWFVATGFGALFAGIFAKLSSIPENIQDVTAQIGIYRHAFLQYFYVSILVAGILLLVRFALRKILREIE